MFKTTFSLQKMCLIISIFIIHLDKMGKRNLSQSFSRNFKKTAPIIGFQKKGEKTDIKDACNTMAVVVVCSGP